jgi:hypothetical protein
LRNPAGILPAHTGRHIKKPETGIFAKKGKIVEATQMIIFPYGQ